ncbi:MAG: fluoride efflux transporter CrcB [Spirochaetota bacterium]|nr:fluoride efflux transporter CrcB [Spirochaetota bacterium]
MKFLFIGMGGFIGALMRYIIAGLIKNPSFPFGTMFVNILGCLLIGFFHSIVINKHVSVSYHHLINIGFLGAFTTFSTFSLETLNLIEEKQYLYSFFNVIISCILGLIAVWIGKEVYRLLWGR